MAISAVASVSTSGVLRHRESARLGGGGVDVVEAHAEVGQQPGPAGLGAEHLGGQPVGHRAEQRVGGPERLLQTVRRPRAGRHD